MPERKVIPVGNAVEFFRAALTEATARERVSLDPLTEQYVLQLLVAQVADAHLPDETLADRYCHAFAAERGERVRLLREVGDTALVVCGLWPDAQLKARRPLDIRYHVSMGRAAYHQLSRDRGLRLQAFGLDLFGDLCDRFIWLVDVLNRLAGAHLLTMPSNVVRLYERWLQTGSPSAARALAELGLVPLAPGSVRD